MVPSLSRQPPQLVRRGLLRSALLGLAILLLAAISVSCSSSATRISASEKQSLVAGCVAAAQEGSDDAVSLSAGCPALVDDVDDTYVELELLDAGDNAALQQCVNDLLFQAPDADRSCDQVD
jgi:hypothetical protein